MLGRYPGVMPTLAGGSVGSLQAKSLSHFVRLGHITGYFTRRAVCLFPF